MAGLEELFPAASPDEPAGLWAGTILDTASVATDEVRVTLPGADGARHAHGPCPFVPRGAVLPSEGDRCLVAIDDEGDPWIVCWTPA